MRKLRLASKETHTHPYHQTPKSPDFDFAWPSPECVVQCFGERGSKILGVVEFYQTYVCGGNSLFFCGADTHSPVEMRQRSRWGAGGETNQDVR